MRGMSKQVPSPQPAQQQLHPTWPWRTHQLKDLETITNKIV
jgi:hypothetical protein